MKYCVQILVFLTGNFKAYSDKNMTLQGFIFTFKEKGSELFGILNKRSSIRVIYRRSRTQVNDISIVMHWRWRVLDPRQELI